MRIAVDGRAFASPAGGVRRYVHELYAAMRRIAPDVHVIALGAPPEARLPDGVERVGAVASLPTNLGWSLSGLPRLARSVAYDVFHAPAYTTPLWGARPLVVTIHDVCYARRPEWYPYAIDPLRRQFYRMSARRADRVLTDSAFSASEIAAAYGIAPSRIDVVALAASPQFAAPPPGDRRELFVLHVGDLHRRRNLAMLLDVVMDLRRAVAACRSLRLVIAGVDRGDLEGLRARAAADAGALDYAGTPGDAELRSLYQRAAVFAYPSRYEGFGLPVLEAMACGAPVVASAAASVPEVVGDSSPTIDPDDVAGWRAAIATLLTDAAAARAASARSVARAAEFSWDRTARETLASLKKGSPPAPFSTARAE